VKLTSRILLVVLPLAGYAAFPLLTGDSYILRILILVHIFAVLAASLDIIVGYVGQLTAGHTALFGWGGYMTAWSILVFNIPPLPSIFIGALFAAGLGFGIGILCLRFRYLLLTLVTFAILVLSFALARQFHEVTGGEQGLLGITRLTPDPILNFYSTLTLMVVSTLILFKLSRSRLGLFMKAIKEDEVAAEVLGVPTVRLKVLANTIGSFFAGLAGGFFATYMTNIAASVFFIDYLLRLLLMWGIGGGGSIIGPVLGAYVVMALSEYLRFIEEYRLIVLGIMLIVIMRFAPTGIYGLLTKVLKRLP
jgi:branched-chain amino acid transport system permease protein